MRSSNPALSEKRFQLDAVAPGAPTMTLSGTVNKSFAMVALVILSAFVSWNILGAQPPMLLVATIGAAIAGFILSLVIIFKQKTAPFLAPVYALLEGVVIGSLSGLLEAKYPGIAMQAAGLTMATFVSLLIAYRTGLIKATENFKLMVVSATGAICLVYLVSIGLSFAGIQMPYLHDSGPIGIGISVFVCAVAALNLVLDFDFIENGVGRQLPQHMEWYAAFGLTVTLVWLYIEFLRLLAKARK